MLLCTEADQWVFKRDPAIRGPLAELGRRTSSGIPYLCPHIQLLYKASRDTLAEDRSDFELAAPRLRPEEQEWLLGHLQRRFADDHPWIVRLKRFVAS